MLKARVQAVMDDRVQGDLNGARCPHCGHTAGLALLPREYRRLSTLVRCFSCQRDAIAFEWVGAPVKVRTTPPRRPGRV